MNGKVEGYVSRFLCKARWRCLLCDSPWFASSSVQKAVRLLKLHQSRGCPQ